MCVRELLSAIIATGSFTSFLFALFSRKSDFCIERSSCEVRDAQPLYMYFHSSRGYLRKKDCGDGRFLRQPLTNCFAFLLILNNMDVSNCLQPVCRLLGADEQANS